MRRKLATTLAVAIALGGVAVAPASAAHLTITPDPLYFGTIYTTTPTTKTVTLTNTGAVPITLTNFTFNDPDFSETDTCAGMIAAGGHCQVAVNITTSTVGAITSAHMMITDTAVGSPQKLPLRATVVALPACAAGSSGSFKYTTHMLAGWRLYHTATTLQNGNVLLVGGLLGPVGVYPGAEIFHFRTCLYTLPRINTKNNRENHTATLLSDGRVLIAGGQIDTVGSHVSASAEIFDPAAHHGLGAFSSTGSVHYPCQYHTATRLADGRVLITGGLTSTSPLPTFHAEIYNPVTGTFSLTSDMNAARVQHTATLLSNGEVLIAGGNGASTAAEVFDLALNGGRGGFQTAGDMSFPRQAHTATPLKVGYEAGGVLLAGGYSQGMSNGLSNADVFSDLLGLETFVATPNAMSVGRMSATANRLLDGNVLVAGGTCNTTATGGQNSADLLMISGPDIGNFEPTGSLVDGLVNHAAALLPDGQVLITGGWQFLFCSSGNQCSGSGCESSATNHAELYHP
jgi:hypothetical protein